MTDLVSTVLLTLPAVLLALSAHEFAHGLIADRLGDPTPRIQGRLTLNPLAHLDPLGTLMLVLYRFGWAKPVMVNPYNFRDPRRGMMYVAIGGPLANITLAYGLAVLWNMLPYGIFGINTMRALAELFRTGILINLWLAAFNLIPIPPLDGSKILMGILPGSQARFFAQLEQIGPLLLLGLIITGIARTLLNPIFQVLAYGLRFL